jgi:glycosyltransferase involved in cell wall biosynthesis
MVRQEAEGEARPGDSRARVLIICNSPDNGGGANLLFRVTRYLDPRRVKTTLLLHRDGWQAAQQRAHGHADVIIEPGIGELDPVPPPTLGNLGSVAKASLSTGMGYGRVIARICRLTRDSGLDVIAGFGAGPAALATLAGTVARRPVIWSAQRCYDDRLTPVPMQVFAVMPAVRRIFAVSRAAAAPYRHLGDKLVIAYNGLDPEDVDPAKIRGTLRTRLRLGADVPLVGMAGRVIHLKGVDLFLRAAGRLAARHPEARFVVIGRREGDAFDAELDRIVREGGLTDRVIFTGWVEDMRSEMLDLDVVAIPSRRDAAPLIAYEAMALARPIVATRCPGLDEQLEDGMSGLYVPREDVGALEHALGRMLEDAGLRRRLGAAARAALVERFDLRRMVREVEDTIVDLAREGRASRGAADRPA